MTFVATEAGERIVAQSAKSAEKLVIYVVEGGDRGWVERNGEVVAGWETKPDGEAEHFGFDQLASSETWGLYLTAIADPGVTAGIKKWLPGVLRPIIPVTIGLIAFCLGQCECCEAYWLNPPPGSNEPSCCDVCFSALCDFGV